MRWARRCGFEEGAGPVLERADGRRATWRGWARPVPAASGAGLRDGARRPGGLAAGDDADRLCRRAVDGGVLHGRGRSSRDFADGRAWAYAEPAADFAALIDAAGRGDQPVPGPAGRGRAPRCCSCSTAGPACCPTTVRCALVPGAARGRSWRACARCIPTCRSSLFPRGVGRRLSGLRGCRSVAGARPRHRRAARLGARAAAAARALQGNLDPLLLVPAAGHALGVEQILKRLGRTVHLQPRPRHRAGDAAGACATGDWCASGVTGPASSTSATASCRRRRSPSMSTAARRPVRDSGRMASRIARSSCSTSVGPTARRRCGRSCSTCSTIRRSSRLPALSRGRWRS